MMGAGALRDVFDRSGPTEKHANVNWFGSLLSPAGIRNETWCPPNQAVSAPPAAAVPFAATMTLSVAANTAAQIRFVTICASTSQFGRRVVGRRRCERWEVD
jgi:hypothetical protein